MSGTPGTTPVGTICSPRASATASSKRRARLSRQIAGERLVLYRLPQGRIIALEDRCAHRQAALSGLGQKEGDDVPPVSIMECATGPTAAATKSPDKL